MNAAPARAEDKPALLPESTAAQPNPPSATGKLAGRLGFLIAALVLLAVGFAAQLARNPEGFRNGLAVLCGAHDDDAAYGPVPSGQRLIERGGKRWLWGGPEDSMHFDLSHSVLNLDRLQYGLGREAFPALIEPRFVSAAKASEWLAPVARVLTVHIGPEVRVYPVDLLMRHEVVNDVVGGRPIFAAYCILADLGAVYDRRIGHHTFTFAVSGYTCGQPDVWDGLQAFVLWDRDTESLWWPTVGKAVSGPLLGTHLKLLERDLWSQTTWGEVKSRYPEARVLDAGQDLQRPRSWPRYEVPSDLPKETQSPPELAPKWGENGLPSGASAATANP